MAVDTGTLEFDGGGELGGTITGAGTLSIAGAFVTDLDAQTGPISTSLVLNGGTLVLQADETVSGNFTDNAGVIDLNGHTLTLTGGVTLNGGEIDGSGTLLTTGSVTLPGSAAVTFGGGAVWSSAGTVSDAGAIYMGDAAGATATIDNQAGGTFDFVADSGAILSGDGGLGSGVFSNAGTLEKTDGTGTSNVAASVANTGLVLAASGTLGLSGGGSSVGDGLTAAAAATLAFAGGDFELNGGTVQGAGTVALTGGTLDTGTLDAVIAASFIQNGGRLTGSSTLTILLPVLLTGGLQDGTGDTVLETGGTIDGYISLDGGRTLTNDGTVTFLGGSTIAMGSGGAGPLHGATIDNAAGALFDTVGDPTLISNGAGYNVLNNYGVFKKELTPGTAEVQVNFNNYGTIINNDGLLSFNGLTPSFGTITAAPSATFSFAPVVISAPVTPLPSPPAGPAQVYVPEPVTITGGAVLTSGTLTFGAPASIPPSPVPITFNNPGTLDVESLTPTTYATINIGDLIVQYMPGTTTLTAGTWIIGNNGTLIFSTPGLLPMLTNDANVTLKTATSVFAMLDTLQVNNGELRILQDQNFTTAGDFTDNGLLQLGGGTFSTGASNFTQATGGTVEGYGTLTGATVALDGTVDASGGDLAIQNGTIAAPLLQSDAGATLDLSADTAPASTATLTAKGALALGGNDVQVTGDYVNANWGVGNSFDPRANVTGGGAIVGEGAGMALVGVDGTQITKDAAGDVVFQLGPYTPGQVITLSFVIVNTGAPGSAALRGAIQTAVNGAAVTYAGLSGSGVTAQDFGPIAAGQQSQVFTITVDTSAGPISGQAIHIASDFANVPGITVSIGTSTGALASPSLAQPNPVSFGNVHVGDVVQKAVTIANTAPSDAAYLDASVGSATGDATAQGSFSDLTPGATNSTDLVVGLSTATAGSESGTATIALTSDTGLPGGTTPLASQTVDVSGTVWRLASASVTPTLDLGVTRVGDIDSGSFSITNTAINDGYSEDLRYSLGAAAGAFSNSGTLTGVVVAQGTGSPTVTLDTDQSGTFTGSLQVTLASTGQGTSGLADTQLAPQTVELTGTVYATAVAHLSTTTIDFGVLHPDQVATQTIEVTNAASGSLTDVLTGGLAVSSAGPFSGTGSLGAGLVAGASGTLSFTFAGGSAIGTYDGSLPLAFSSHDSAQADVAALGDSNVVLEATVENYAQAGVALSGGAGTLTQTGTDTYVLNFGSLGAGSKGGAVTADLSVSNIAPGLADLLSGNFIVAGGAGFTNAGLVDFSGLGAGASDTAPSITLQTGTAGTFSETITLDPTGSNSSGYVGALAPETIEITGTVLPAPALTIPAAQSVEQGATATIAGISVADAASSGTVTVVLTDTAGVLAASGGAATNGGHTLTLTGSVSTVNTELTSLTFVDATAGSDVIDVNASDPLGGVASQQTIAITVSPAGQTYTLTMGTDIINGGPGNNTIIARTNTLTSGDQINGGSGTNTLELLGGGTFNLAAPKTLTNIAFITAQEGEGTTAQTVTLRAGLNATLNVASDTARDPSPGITIIGAANSDVINLGSGNDTVTLGAGETVNSGGGNNSFQVAAATLGSVTINGGTTGTNTLILTSGGTATMGAGITGIASVQLTAATTFTANAIAGLQIIAGAGTDKITAGAAGQVLVAGTGTDTLTGSSAGGDTFSGTAAGLNGDTIGNLLASNVIDITNLAPATAVITSYQVSAAKTVLTLTDGTNSTTFTLSGADYGSFALAADGSGGTDLTFAPNPSLSTFTLPTTPVTISAGPVSSVIVATAASLPPADSITGGSGTGVSNELLLSGGGAFNLAALTKLSNIEVISAQEGEGATAQTVTLRAGLTATVNVASDPSSGDTSPGITIIGAANGDVINLGSGNDAVTLGTGETANSGGGNNSFTVAAATLASVIINGGTTGTNTLILTGGGTATMGSRLSGITAVQLAAPTTFTANATAGLQISGSSAGGDTITLGAATQSVIAGGANETVKATTANAGAAVSGLGANSTLEITNGGTATLNATTDVDTVKLDAVSTLVLNGMQFITAVGTTGSDTIEAGASNQTLTSLKGSDTLTGSSAGNDIFLGTAAGLNGDTIGNLLASNVIDITNLAPATAVITSYQVSAAKTVLTLTDGTNSTTFTLSGADYGSFALAADGSGGTDLTFAPNPSLSTFTLPTTPVTISAGPVSSVIVATAASLPPADSITGGSGTGVSNELLLSGGGAFNLAALTKLSNIEVISAQEGEGATAQTVTLRAGLTATVNVASDPSSGDTSPGITIIGAANGDVINLGSGNDAVTLGTGETANSGGGNNSFTVAAATLASVIINGGTTGTNTLILTGGGTATMGSRLSGITAVQLAAPTTFTANATAGLQISGSSAGGDTITLGAATQSVIAGGANETVKATTANAGAAVSGLGANSTLEITNGGTATLNATTNVDTVKLDAVSTLVLNGMQFITAVGTTGSDTIEAGASNQTLTSLKGSDTLTGSSAGNDIFLGTAAGLNGDTIKNFVVSDMIDITNLAFAGATLSTAASGANTKVTLTSGTTSSVFTLAGSWSSAGFHLASDGAGGTVLTHT